VQSLGFASIGVGYTVVGVGAAKPGIILILANFTDAAVMFSFTGNTDHIPVAANSSIIIDIQSDKDIQGDVRLSAYTQYFVKRLTGSVPTSGSFYVSHFYNT